MSISRYQKLFGVGPVLLLVSLILLGLLWLLDKGLHYTEILSQPGPLRIIGLALVGLWICWHFWCIRTIRLWWREGRLCTSGPFRFVRHPMYAGGIFLAGFGVSLMFNSWIMLLWLVLAFPIYSVLVQKEERTMTAVFGEEYSCYAARTGRLFPHIFK